MKFLGNMSIYQQIVYHRVMQSFGAKTGADSQRGPLPAKKAGPRANSLLQKDWGRNKGATHA